MHEAVYRLQYYGPSPGCSYLKFITESGLRSEPPSSQYSGDVTWLSIDTFRTKLCPEVRQIHELYYTGKAEEIKYKEWYIFDVTVVC